MKPYYWLLSPSDLAMQSASSLLHLLVWLPRSISRKARGNSSKITLLDFGNNKLKSLKHSMGSYHFSFCSIQRRKKARIDIVRSREFFADGRVNTGRQRNTIILAKRTIH
jgi:hypothetical protein